MLDAAYWTTRLAELARQARVPGAVLGIWPGGTRVQLWGLPRSFGPAGLITAAAHDLLTFTRC